MITWGISGNSHDASLAVFTNEGLEFASQSERFSGIKNDAHLNQKLVDYARQWGEPDQIIWYEKPLKKTWRQFRAGQGITLAENNIKKYLQQWNINAPIKTVDHHLSHVAGGYYTSQFDDAVVLCIDSIGEFETITVWQGRGDKLTKIYSQDYPHSIGLWYSAMTQRIGLKPNEDEYILMGMAAYGDSRYYRHQIMHDFFESIKLPIKFKQNLHRGCRDWRSELDDDHNFNIAAGTQWVYETVLENIVEWCSKNTTSKNIVFMGGCALNCSANHILLKYFDKAWIMPNPGDSGSAIGAVLAHKKTHMEFKHAYLGYEIKENTLSKKQSANLRKRESWVLRMVGRSLALGLLAIVAYLLIHEVRILNAESTTLKSDNNSVLSPPPCSQNTTTRISKDLPIVICSLPPVAKIQTCILPSLTSTEQAESKWLNQMVAEYEDC